jgi:hypothetical protein
MLFKILKWNSIPKLKAALSPTSGVDQAEKLTARMSLSGGGDGVLNNIRQKDIIRIRIRICIFLYP